MQKININFTTTIGERFFIERSLELLFGQTIDSYRMRHHNSYTILEELAEVMDKLKKNQLKHEQYAKCIAEEAHSFLKDDDVIKWGSISSTYFLNHLLPPKPNTQNYTVPKEKLYLGCKTLLRYNKRYLDNLFVAIRTEIIRLNSIEDLANPAELSKLNHYTSSFWTGLRYLGYSKEYLHNFIRALAIKTNISFGEFIDIIEALLSREKERFIVILGIKLYLQEEQFSSEHFKILSTSEKRQLSESEFRAVRQYFSKEYGTLLKSEVEALDYYSAAKIVKDRLFPELDILHIGQSDKKNYVYPSWLVIGSKFPEKAKPQKFDYQIDGYYQSSIRIYEIIAQKMKKIKEKGVHKNAHNKITAGLRYFRLGSESTELQTKLLEYWIGMEYLFSGYESDEGTMQRLKRFYKKMHALLLFKRLIYDFHLTVKNLGQEVNISTFEAENLEYLMNSAVYNDCVSQINDYPLYAYRAYRLQTLFTDPKNLRAMIDISMNGLEWHLTRLYRFRNEIVHNAAIKSDIESLVSHLKFYLLFTICSLMDFFAEKAEDYNYDGQISLDDYFEIREMRFDNLMHKKDFIDVQQLKKFMNPLEFLT
jgi:hypothetical protein